MNLSACTYPKPEPNLILILNLIVIAILILIFTHNLPFILTLILHFAVSLVQTFRTWLPYFCPLNLEELIETVQQLQWFLMLCKYLHGKPFGQARFSKGMITG